LRAASGREREKRAPRAQGPESTLRRLSQSGLRGRANAASAQAAKRGFNSLTREDTAEVLLSDLERVKAEKIDLAVLKEAASFQDRPRGRK